MIGANQCPHGSLRRSCEICDLERECERLRAINSSLVAALEQCLPILDKHRRYALGEGDLTAHCARAALARAKGQS
jgi:hypothetical protein